MPLPITNSATTLNRNNDCNLNEEKPEYVEAEYSGYKVFYSKKPTNRIPEKPSGYNYNQTNLDDRRSTLANSLNKSTIKPFNEFSNKNDMLEYFLIRMTSIYQKKNLVINPKFKKYISERKELKSCDNETVKNLYNFLKNFSHFIPVYLSRDYNEIIDIMDTLFYITNNRLCITTSLIKHFGNLTDQQIQELAENKSLYIALLSKKQLSNIDLNNIEHITNSRIENNRKKAERIYRIVATSKLYNSKKYFIKNDIIKIFSTCKKKNIDIDDKLESIIKNSVNSKKRTNPDITEIFGRIKFVFESFDDCNAIKDTSILTNILCYGYGKITNQLVVSLCNINNEQIRFITSRKSGRDTMRNWASQGFPATEQIDKIIDDLKKNNTTDNSSQLTTLVSASCSKLQPNVINLTETDSPTDKALDPKQRDIDDTSKKIDDIVESLKNGTSSPKYLALNDNGNFNELFEIVENLEKNSIAKDLDPKQGANIKEDELFALLNAIPYFSTEPNNITNPNSVTTKRLDNEEHSPIYIALTETKDSSPTPINSDIERLTPTPDLAFKQRANDNKTSDNIPNQDNQNPSTKGASVKFSGLEVSATNPTNSIQNQAETFKTSQTNIDDRLSTPANSLTIEPFNVNESIDSVINQITSLYKENNVELKTNFISYINKIKARKAIIKDIKAYYFLNKFFKFMSEAFKKGYNEIFDITDAFIYKLGSEGKVYIRQHIINNFIDLTDKQVQEIAGNKNVYMDLLVTKQLNDIDFNNIDSITNLRIANNTIKTEKIYKIIDTSKINDSQKSLIKEYATNIFEICRIKNIDIDDKLESIIKNSVNSRKRANADIKEIFGRIKFFFESFDDCNAINDTSILTNICCYNYGRTNGIFVKSICNITYEQIKFITSCKNRRKILQPWTYQGFPTTKEIEQIISKFKKDNTTDNSFYISADRNKTQPNINDLTKTEDSPPTAKDLDPEQEANGNETIDDIFKERDHRVDAPPTDNNNENFDEEFAAWLHSPPIDSKQKVNIEDDMGVARFLPEPNSTTNPKSELSRPVTKRLRDNKEQEDSQGKKPKLS